MPDEKTSETSDSRPSVERDGAGGEAAADGSPGEGREQVLSDEDIEPDEGIYNAEQLSTLPRITKLTVVLVLLFILSAVALLSVLNLPGVRDYFEGEAAFWILRVGLLVMIASIVVYFVMRERSTLRFAEKLLAEMAEANQRLRLLLRAERDIGSSLELETTLEETLRYTFGLTGSQMGAVYLWDKGAEVLRLSLVRGVDASEVARDRVAPGVGQVGKAAVDRELRIIEDVSSEPESDRTFSTEPSPSSEAVVPLAAGGKFVGVIAVATTEPRSYGAAEQRMLLGLAELASISITNAELMRISRRSLQAAARQRRFTGQVLDEMVAGLMTADNSGNITVFNREAQRLTGYTPDEVPTIDRRPGLTLEQRPLGQLEQGILDVLNDPSSVREGDALILKKDRTLMPVSFRANPLLEGPNVVGATVVFTEEKEPSRASSSREDLDYQLLLRSLGSRIEMLFIHPLARVIEQVRGMDADEWARAREEFLRGVEAGSGALSNLLEDVEQYLSCVTLREWDAPAECDTAAAVAEVVERVLRSPESEGVVVSVKMADTPPAFGFERMIKTALEKVVENACLAAADGGKKVEVSARSVEGAVRVEIADTGPGVDEDTSEFIFHPFFTTREGRSGLGLPTARRVVDRLEGRLGLAESESGALFFLEFPCSPPPGGGAGSDTDSDGG
jgi:signal transduction histidine kinase